MLILGLESSAKIASCALGADGRRIALYTQDCGLTHSSTLLPMAEDMLRNCGVELRALTHIAVAAGPGSFTGVRIGCSSAKGLCFALGIPCRPVSTLEAMARAQLSTLTPSTRVIISCEMDARRGQLYNAVFAFNGVMLTRITPDRAIAASELESELQAFDAPVVRRLESDAWGVILAAEHAADAEPTPVYLRPSQAERELLEKRHD